MLRSFLDRKAEDLPRATRACKSVYSSTVKAMAYGPFVLYLGLIAAGALRAVFNVALPHAIFLAIGGSFCAIIATIVSKPFPSLDCRKFLALSVASFTVFCAILFDPIFGGLPGGGGDSGNHVAIMHAFANLDSHAYLSFIGFHTSALFFQKIFALNDFESFRATFYFTVYLIASLSTGIIGGLCSKRPILSWVVLQVSSILIILPALAYNQQDGFFAHLYSIPLFLIFGICGSIAISSRYLKLGVLGTIVVFLRYTYGLDLPDAIMLFSIYIWTNYAETKFIKRSQYAVAVAVAIIASFSTYRIFGIMAEVGAYRKPAISGLALYQILTLFGLSTILLAGKTAKQDEFGLAYIKFTRLALAIFMMTEIIYWFSPAEQTYYFFKHFLVPTVLAGIMIPSLVNAGIDIWQAQRQKQRIAFLAYSALITASILVGMKHHRKILSERFLHEINADTWHILTPMADSYALDQIPLILQKSQKQFGGILLPYWGMASFMHASLAHELLSFAAYSSGQLTSIPDSCQFWYADSEFTAAYRRNGTAQINEKQIALNLSPAKICSDHAVPWEATLVRLCWVCL